MFGFFGKKKDVELKAPVNGTMIDLTQVPDKVFASKMMGEGVAFVYDDNIVCAPVDGTITLIPNSLHAIGMTTDIGLEVLVHIGLDTVSLNGKGFKKLANQGDKVKAGTPIIQIDREFMKEKGIDLTTPMVITNSSDYNVEIISNSTVTTNDVVLKCSKK